jgi:hypothetical protein
MDWRAPVQLSDAKNIEKTVEKVGRGGFGRDITPKLLAIKHLP